MTTSDSLSPKPMAAETPAEEKLLEAVKTGVKTGEAVKISEGLDPEQAEGWGDEHTIRADFLRHVCLYPDSYEVDPWGVRIEGGLIADPLNFNSCTLSRPLKFEKCRFDSQPDFEDAKTCFLAFGGCYFPGFKANSITVSNSLWLSECTLEGGIDLRGATISGELSCGRATFKNEGSIALSADNLKVGGSVYLTSVTATGLVCLMGANIQGQLNCQGAKFTNVGGMAFNADQMRVGGSVFLRSVAATGEARLMGADIKGQLNCEDTTFANEVGTAFNAESIKVGGHVLLKGVNAIGKVCLLGADIKGGLECTAALFKNKGDDAFNADHMTVGSGVSLQKARVVGRASIASSFIKGELDCLEAKFVDNGDKNGQAFFADGTTVAGSVSLQNTEVTGGVRLLGTDIGGQLNCRGAAFTNQGGYAFIAQAMHVMQGVLWYPKVRPVGNVDFSFAQVDVFDDNPSGWPHGLTLLDGFEYKRFGTNTVAETRIAWLKQMPQEFNGAPVFYPQPYEQVIKVFKDAGHEHEARKVAIAKQDEYAAHLRRVQIHGKRNTMPRRVLARFFKITAGYGYKPWRALLWASWFILVMGWSIFGGAAYSGHMRPAKERIYMSACFTDVNAKDCKAWKAVSLSGDDGRTVNLPPDYPTFSALSYSLDVFVPIVDLHQESYWLPNEGQYRIYMWLHIVAGWVLTTIAVTGFAGVLKKD